MTAFRNSLIENDMYMSVVRGAGYHMYDSESSYKPAYSSPWLVRSNIIKVYGIVMKKVFLISFL